MKYSAAEVEARIGPPPANAIHLKNESPANLELHDIELAGTTLDPVARLPFEIASEIFVQCIPSRPKPGANHIPMVLLNICRAWTAIALSTPQLWNSIHVVFPRPEGFTGLLEAWLQRARNRSLSISLRGSFGEDVGTIVRRHTQHLRKLEVYLDGEDVELLSRIGPCPSLTTLKIGAIICEPDLSWSVIKYSALHMLTILQLAPNLVECTLEGISPTFFPDSHNSADIIILPSLRRLNFWSILDSPSYDKILRNLTLPALQTLALRMFAISLNDLIAFLKRSSPPLLGLTIDASDSDFIHFLNDFPRLAPTLECLELYYPYPDAAKQLFALLSASPSHFLPNLRSLHVYANNYSLSISESTWTNVLHTLSIRRSHITDFKLKSRGRLSEPPVSVLAGLRELVADGLEIYIGNKERNYIAA
ncbi:hypothetical protein B0H11DRAFT_2062038 [Mycena galericulata]|nr:hypothetical protein B0H11DRAFT_2062038 [Mycena galericulata]